MSKTKKILLTVTLIGAIGGLAGFATFSAFSSTTTNPGNTFDTGSVILGDNDANAAMYNVTNRGPGSSTVRCITVTYTGTMPADVSLYTPSTIDAGGQYIDLTIEAGTGSPVFSGCTGFVSDATIYTGTLSAFGTAHNTYANGVPTYPGVQTEWDQTDSVTYRYTLTVQDDNNAQNQIISAHDFTWEARNQ